MCADVKNKRTSVTVTSYATILTGNVDLFPETDVFNAFFYAWSGTSENQAVRLCTHPSVWSALKDLLSYCEMHCLSSLDVLKRKRIMNTI
jgi:hypothetical protein